MERGAGSLTFEEIAQESGVTRGGITYHFPTKQDLLRGLVADDLAQWKTLEREFLPADCNTEKGELLAFLKSHTHKNHDRRRFVTGMLSAAMLDPPILDPVREFESRRLQDIEWDEHTLRLQLLRLAALGLFWSDVFGCPELPVELNGQLVDLLETLADEWSDRASDDG